MARKEVFLAGKESDLSVLEEASKKNLQDADISKRKIVVILQWN